MKKFLFLTLLFFCVNLSAGFIDIDVDSETGSFINGEEASYQVIPTAEFGYVGVTTHIIQLGSSGTMFNYVTEGGQNNLFDYLRAGIDLKWKKRHIFTFLYQPLNFVTENILERDVTIDGQLFPKDTPMKFVYGFTYFRLSYMYDFFKGEDELGFGISLQLRNATIIFSSLDGELLRENRNIGPVPIIKFRYTKNFDSGAFISTEWDGFYASSAYINGGDNDFTGSILDCSLRAGIELKHRIKPFINIRYIGGGGLGTDDDGDNYDDGFTENWLSLVTLSLGVSLF